MSFPTFVFVLKRYSRSYPQSIRYRRCVCPTVKSEPEDNKERNAVEDVQAEKQTLLRSGPPGHRRLQGRSRDGRILSLGRIASERGKRVLLTSEEGWAVRKERS